MEEKQDIAIERGVTLYESHYVLMFGLLWGQRGFNPDDALLGNAQNPFDALIGDVVANANARFFIIEFKRDRAGIAQEIVEKAHRGTLYLHLCTLKENDPCLNNSMWGHFAAYPHCGELTFEPYFHAAAANATGTMSFNQFHEAMTSDDLVTIPENCNVGARMFRTGSGLTTIQFAEYVQCMYQHLETGLDETNGQCVLGVTYEKDGKQRFKTVVASVESLVRALTLTLSKFASDIQKNRKPAGP